MFDFWTEKTAEAVAAEEQDLLTTFCLRNWLSFVLIYLILLLFMLSLSCLKEFIEAIFKIVQKMTCMSEEERVAYWEQRKNCSKPPHHPELDENNKEDPQLCLASKPNE